MGQHQWRREFGTQDDEAEIHRKIPSNREVCMVELLIFHGKLGITNTSIMAYNIYLQLKDDYSICTLRLGTTQEGGQ